MAELVTKHIDMQVSDGTTMGGYLARPVGEGPFPGVLVFQEIFGVNAHIRNVTDRLAAEGYIALAPELFHRSEPGFQSGYDDLEPGLRHMEAMTVEGATADAKAAYDWLMSDPLCNDDKIGAVGFCMGGRMSFMANWLLPIQASVSFYGGGIAQTQLGHVDRMHAPALLFWAGHDPFIPSSDVQAVAEALRSAQKDFVQTEFSYTQHGFFCDARSSYNATAASQAWALTKAFLSSHLGH